jgi:membrane protein implicated in regulation of membrane protease activity
MGPALIWQGILGCFFALLMWRLTGSFWGWLVIFIPASVCILYGWYRILKDGDRE